MFTVKSGKLKILKGVFMATAFKSGVIVRRKQVRSVPRLTFAQERAKIKLPYKPAHVTEAQIKEAVRQVAEASA